MIHNRAVSRRHFVYTGLTLLSGGRLLSAQEPTTFSTDVKVVNVLATVHDKHGQIIHDLKKDDFQLDEDGRPQAIKYFAAQSDLPLTLGLPAELVRWIPRKR